MPALDRGVLGDAVVEVHGVPVPAVVHLRVHDLVAHERVGRVHVHEEVSHDADDHEVELRQQQEDTKHRHRAHVEAVGLRDRPARELAVGQVARLVVLDRVLDPRHDRVPDEVVDRRAQEREDGDPPPVPPAVDCDAHEEGVVGRPERDEGAAHHAQVRKADHDNQQPGHQEHTGQALVLKQAADKVHVRFRSTAKG